MHWIHFILVSVAEGAGSYLMEPMSVIAEGCQTEEIPVSSLSTLSQTTGDALSVATSATLAVEASESSKNLLSDSAVHCGSEHVCLAGKEERGLSWTVGHAVGPSLAELLRCFEQLSNHNHSESLQHLQILFYDH